MSLELIMKIIGWTMAIVPYVIFNAISAYMVIGAGKDDATIKALYMLGISVFAIGVILLVFSYFTSVLA